MIAGGDLEPCIVCTPTYKNAYCQDDASCVDVFYQELVNDLIPALEGKYATAYKTLCGEKTGEEQEALSVQQTEEKTRLSRGFGGFSMGAVTTWNVFRHCLKEVGFFMPISGQPWACNSEELAESVEKTFSVSTGTENAAIAGFSMGGREALYIGIQHPEQFGYVGAVCPAPGLVPGTDPSQHPGRLTENELTFDENNGSPYLLYLAGAREDGAVGDTPSQLHDLLNKNKVDHVWQLFDGT